MAAVEEADMAAGVEGALEAEVDDRAEGDGDQDGEAAADGDGTGAAEDLAAVDGGAVAGHMVTAMLSPTLGTTTASRMRTALSRVPDKESRPTSTSQPPQRLLRPLQPSRRRRPRSQRYLWSAPRPLPPA